MIAPAARPLTDCPVLLVVSGDSVSWSAIERTAELAESGLVTVIAVASDSVIPGQARAGPEPLRRTVASALSALDSHGVLAVGHVVVTQAPGRALARAARARSVRAIVLDQRRLVPAYRRGTGTDLVADVRRRMYGTGVIVAACYDRVRPLTVDELA